MNQRVTKTAFQFSKLMESLYVAFSKLGWLILKKLPFTAKHWKYLNPKTAFKNYSTGGVANFDKRGGVEKHTAYLHWGVHTAINE